MIGAAVGAGVAQLLSGAGIVQQAQPCLVDDSELKKVKGRLALLEAELVAAKSAASVQGDKADHRAERAGEVPTMNESAGQHEEDGLRWRVSALEKFIPLTDQQKERLRDKYRTEKEAQGSGEDPGAESLDDIVGTESAQYYREQVQAAFKRVQDEEVEREVVWLSRKLALSTEQENSVKTILSQIEDEMSKGRSHGESRATPQERMRAMVADNRRRTELRNEQLRGVFSPDQFQVYVQVESESSAADAEVFHDPGAGR